MTGATANTTGGGILAGIDAAGAMFWSVRQE
jgi:hypothetical protein